MFWSHGLQFATFYWHIKYKVQANVGISDRRITNFMNSESTREGRGSLLCPESERKCLRNAIGILFAMFSFRAMLVYGTSIQIQNWLPVYVFPVCRYTCHNEIFLTNVKFVLP